MLIFDWTWACIYMLINVILIKKNLYKANSNRWKQRKFFKTSFQWQINKWGVALMGLKWSFRWKFFRWLWCYCNFVPLLCYWWLIMKKCNWKLYCSPNPGEGGGRKALIKVPLIFWFLIVIFYLCFYHNCGLNGYVYILEIVLDILNQLIHDSQII